MTDLFLTHIAAADEMCRRKRKLQKSNVEDADMLICAYTNRPILRSDSGPSPMFLCTVCEIPLKQPIKAFQHFTGKKHIQNEYLKMAGKPIRLTKSNNRSSTLSRKQLHDTTSLGYSSEQNNSYNTPKTKPGMGTNTVALRYDVCNHNLNSNFQYNEHMVNNKQQDISRIDGRAYGNKSLRGNYGGNVFWRDSGHGSEKGRGGGDRRRDNDNRARGRGANRGHSRGGDRDHGRGHGGYRSRDTFRETKYDSTYQGVTISSWNDRGKRGGRAGGDTWQLSYYEQKKLSSADHSYDANFSSSYGSFSSRRKPKPPSFDKDDDFTFTSWKSPGDFSILASQGSSQNFQTRMLPDLDKQQHKMKNSPLFNENTHSDVTYDNFYMS